jgi:hypothetical protein
MPMVEILATAPGGHAHTNFPGYGIGVRGQTLDLEPASSSLAPGAWI